MLPSTLIRRTLGWDSPLSLFDGELGRSLQHLWQEGQPMDHVGMYPVDIHEDDNHIYVEAEMPGFSRDQINVTLEKGLLQIQAQRSACTPDNTQGSAPNSTPDSAQANGANGSAQGQANVIQNKPHGDVTCHLSERRYTRVSRSFSLPNTVDENKVDARLEDGVLHLTLHKREEVRPRRIEVK